jgi:hypothetical protein
MASTTPSRAGSWTHGRLAQDGVGLGVAASVLASVAVATTAPTASPAPAPANAAASVVRAPSHTQINPYSSVRASARTVHAGQRITISGNAPHKARAAKSITLLSDAFATKHAVNGIRAIRTQVLVKDYRPLTIHTRRPAPERRWPFSSTTTLTRRT